MSRTASERLEGVCAGSALAAGSAPGRFETRRPAASVRLYGGRCAAAVVPTTRRSALALSSSWLGSGGGGLRSAVGGRGDAGEPLACSSGVERERVLPMLAPRRY